MNGLKFRRVKETDIWDIYKLSNDPTVRFFSISRKPISRKEHIDWFQKVDKRFFFVAQLGSEVVGQIRFDKREENLYEVSISVHPLHRGKGIGKFLLSEGLKKLLKEVEKATVIARVREENRVSRRLFEGFGFQELKRENGIIFYRYGGNLFETSRGGQ